MGGVALVVAAVLVNLSVLRAAGRRVSVVRMARDVAVGQVVTRADLAVARLALDSGVASIPGRQLSEVVGRRAAVDLRAGTLVAASQLTAQLTPRPGQALVTVSLKRGLVPPRGLVPGAAVRVVATPGDQDGAAPGREAGAGQEAGPGGKPAVRDVAATVDAVGGADADGSVSVALLVAEADSAMVARQAADGRVALVVTARGG